METFGHSHPLRVLGIGNARSVIFLRWAWRLRELGHDVHVVSDRFSARSEELAGIGVHDIRTLGRLNNVRGVRRLRFGATIRALARELEIDVVHGHYLLPYGFWAALAGHRPLVISPWGTDILVEPGKGGERLRRARAALSAADALVVNSAANASACVRLGVDPERIEQVVWYADLGRFGPELRDERFRAGLGWPDDAFVVLSLRNFRPDTNVDCVVRGFERLLRAEPRARLVLASKGGPLQAEVEALVDALGLRNHVAFVTAHEAELPTVVASSDVLVAMTRSDSTPASLLEAMASERPAVCADAASIDEWIGHGDGGAIVPQLDEAALAAELLVLARDPELRLRHGLRNRRYVAEHVTEPGPALDALYRRLVGAEAVVPSVSASPPAATPAAAVAVARR
ncbi:MAG: glycosyltransferase [Actinomycetota bacterium]